MLQKWSIYKIRWVLRESPIANCTNGPVGTKCVSGERLRRGRRGRDGNGTDKNGVVKFSSALERDINGEYCTFNKVILMHKIVSKHTFC